MENIITEISNCKAGRIMVVDDEPDVISPLCEMLTDEGYETAGFCKGSEAIETLTKQEFDLLITDLIMPDMDGIDVLRAGLEIDPNLVGIIMTGHATVQTAIEAMKAGAIDYILKPFKMENLLPVLSRAMQIRSLRAENLQLRETLAIHELGKAIAFSSDLNSIMNMVADAALLQCKADEVSIMLPTADGKNLYIAAASGSERAENIGIHIPIEQGIAGWVARNHEPVVLQGEVNDPRMAPIKPRSEIHTAVSMPMMSSGKIVGVLNVNITKNYRHFTMGQLKALGILVSIVSPILEKTQLYIQLIKSVEDTVRAMAMIVEKRDMYTAGHQERVANLAVNIANDMKLSEKQVNGLRLAGIIHDIGKLNVPSEILTKPTALNRIELELVKMHAEAGYNILETIDFPYPVAQIVYQHHERMNGSGYPRALKGNEILIESRILAVADVVEAISSHRPYRPAQGIDKALKEISDNKCILYDPTVAEACLRLFNEKGFKL